MAYQAKYHRYICEVFRYLSFVLVVITLLTWLSYYWLLWPTMYIVKKFVATTIAVLLASVITKIIFAPEKAQNEKPKSTPSF